MTRINIIFYRFILLIPVCLFTDSARAQNNLERTISIHVKQLKLADLLTEIGKRGNFFFSYGSDMIRTDSLVTVEVSNKPIRILLDELFNNDVAYKEAPGYIILRPAPNRLKLMPEFADEQENTFNISGYVLDDRTGAPVRYASVYENRLLMSTLTDQQGFFRLKLKSAGAITLTVSKEMYKDTSINVLSKVTVSPKTHNYAYNADTGSTNAEKNWLGKLFISSKMKIQSLNFGGFISGVPVQTSFVPGWGSHGLMSGQIANDFSLNILGGYNAGVNGVELGGLFNLNKQDVKYVQAAGLFNVVGGNFTGIQLAGIHNAIYKNVKGVQAAGIFNQADNSAGLQLAGIANITHKEATGVQAAGIINHAQKLKGVHLAIFNIADTLEGVAINLMSFSHNGYHQLSVYTDDNLITLLAYKSGNARLYTKLTGGINFFETDKYYACGFALGHDFDLKKGILLSAEFSNQFLLSNQWNNTHQLNRFSALLNMPIANKVSVFFGPSINLCDVGQNNTIEEQMALTKNKIALTGIGRSFKSWLGWSVGMTLF